jgi:apolipoprotein N-acyltransferase
MVLINKIKYWQLALVSGLMLALAWPIYGCVALLFIGFIPLLYVESRLAPFSNLNAFNISYITFFCWNAGSTWWILNSSLGGAIMAIVFNSVFMSLVFMLYHHARSCWGRNVGYACFVVYWTGFEYLHLNWDLSWPWLTLGNGLAGNIKLVQWYECTGVLGGSVWVLLVNILLLKVILARIENTNEKKNVILLFLFLIVPLIFSYWRFNTYEEKKQPVKIAIVQPNIDPYTEKFGSMSSSQQLDLFINLAKTVLDSNTEYLAGPETAVPDGIWEDRLQQSLDLNTLKNFNGFYPHLKTIIGVTSYNVYKKGAAISETARQYPNDDRYYDAYNTAVQVSHKDPLQLYHKSKLVLGVEMIPYPMVFKYFEKLAINLGGTTGSLGTQKERSIFTSKTSKNKVAPVICYESIYGEFVTGYVKKGANLIFILTNDGWWGDTPGYKQHLAYAQLRAIENRRSIARSANTGTSCFINQKGEISQATSWWQPAAIKGFLNANETLTFYSQHGDLIGRLCGWLSLFLFPFALLNWYRKKKINS